MGTASLVAGNLLGCALREALGALGGKLALPFLVLHDRRVARVDELGSQSDAQRVPFGVVDQHERAKPPQHDFRHVLDVPRPGLACHAVDHAVRHDERHGKRDVLTMGDDPAQPDEVRAIAGNELVPSAVQQRGRVMHVDQRFAGHVPPSRWSACRDERVKLLLNA